MLTLEATKPNDDEPIYVIHTLDKPKPKVYVGVDPADLIGSTFTIKVQKSGEFTWLRN